MQTQERLKQQRVTFKSQVDDEESDISEVRKRLTAQQKEISGAQKQINSVETKLEQKRADRHSLLKTCKVWKTRSVWTADTKICRSQTELRRFLN